MRKIVLILILFSASIGCASKSVKSDSLIPKSEFGHTTLNSLDEGNYHFSCEDARSLILMMGAMKEDVARDKGANAPYEAESGNMTQAMKIFDESINKLDNAIGIKFSNDNATKEKVLNALGSNLSEIFQVLVYRHMGMLDDSRLNEFIEVTFCGKTPGKDYKSPLEEDFTPELERLEK